MTYYISPQKILYFGKPDSHPIRFTLFFLPIKLICSKKILELVKNLYLRTMSWWSNGSSEEERTGALYWLIPHISLVFCTPCWLVTLTKQLDRPGVFSIILPETKNKAVCGQLKGRCLVWKRKGPWTDKAEEMIVHFTQLPHLLCVCVCVCVSRK